MSHGERRPILCLVTDAAPRCAEVVHAAVAAGVDWIQLRDRSLEAGELLELARELRAAANDATGERADACALIVNRRIDVALALADESPDGVRVGIHLGFDAAPLAPAREALAQLVERPGPVGVATHGADEAAKAAAAGADYVHLAPIFDPLSKPRERPALGTAALAEASHRMGTCRLLAQGGIEATNVAEALRAGAAGVAVTGAILDAPHPGRAAASLRATLDGAAG